TPLGISVVGMVLCFPSFQSVWVGRSAHGRPAYLCTNLRPGDGEQLMEFLIAENAEIGLHGQSQNVGSGHHAVLPPSLCSMMSPREKTHCAPTRRPPSFSAI